MTEQEQLTNDIKALAEAARTDPRAELALRQLNESLKTLKDDSGDWLIGCERLRGRQ